jgi:hypothetical protein
MITVKITPSGGYICGDGPIPGNLNPDEFYKLFSARIIAAKARGLTELGIEDEEVQRLVDVAVLLNNQQVDEAPIQRFEENIEPNNLLDQVEGLYEHQRQQIRDMNARGEGQMQIPGW